MASERCAADAFEQAPVVGVKAPAATAADVHDADEVLAPEQADAGAEASPRSPGCVSPIGLSASVPDDHTLATHSLQHRVQLVPKGDRLGRLDPSSDE